METSVSTSVLKGVTTYLSSLNARSAVYSDDLTLIWTSTDEFFKTVDSKFISDALPIKEERYLSLVVDDERYTVSIAPLYRSKRLVSGYVCVMRDSTDVYMMANSSAVSDHAVLFLEDIQRKANRIISIGKVLDGLIPEGENGEKMQELLRDIYVQSMRICTEASANIAIMPLQRPEAEAPTVNCHVSALISTLCSETSQCLVKTKRKLVKHIDTNNYYAKVDYRILAVAFMSMLRSHLYISPLKSDIQVSTHFDGGNYCITVASELLPEADIEWTQLGKSKKDWGLAKKIAVSDCGGSLDFTAENNTAISEMKLPVIKKNRGASLNGVNSGYLSGKYKPVHPFIDEITCREEQLIAAEREPQALQNGQKKTEK